MLGGSYWNAGCIILFITGFAMRSPATAAFAVILFLLGIIIKFLVVKEDNHGQEPKFKK